MPVPRLETCPVCEYSLQGLPDHHRCPECGYQYDKDTTIIREADRRMAIPFAFAAVWLLIAIVFITMGRLRAWAYLHLGIVLESCFLLL